MNSKVLEELKCSPYLIKHSEAVLKKSQEISSNFDVDLETVCTGALLHDIGRLKTQDIQHGVEGGQLLKELGFPPEIVRIAEVHIGAGIFREEAKLMGLLFKDYLPETLEEKIVAHADNLIHGTEEVPLEFVLKKWEKSIGKDHPSLDRLRKLHIELII